MASSIFRPSYTKPLPAGAVVVEVDGQRLARWTDSRGKRHEGKLTARGDRVLVESGTLWIRYKHADGLTRPEKTDCATLDGAKRVLQKRKDDAELQLSGLITETQAQAVTSRRAPVALLIGEYLDALRGKRGRGGKSRVSPRHVANVETLLRRIVADCRFSTLREFSRLAVERWIAAREAEATETADGKPCGMSGRRINGHVEALAAFAGWLVETNKLPANPFARMKREGVEARRVRRSFTADELRRLLDAARRRDVAEYGRPTVKPAGGGWTKAPLTPANLAECELRAIETTLTPERVQDLRRRGFERSTCYKLGFLTGLRWNELRSLRIRSCVLDESPAFVVLAAADAKNGESAEIPLRADVAADLRTMLADRLAALRQAARLSTKPMPVKLPGDAPLFDAPLQGIRPFNRDLLAAGIEKLDARGRVADVHCLRHSFASHLAAARVEARTVQFAMRHSTLKLTDRYTDKRLIDVARELDKLPGLDAPDAGRVLATGTDGAGAVGDYHSRLSDSCRNGGQTGQELAASGERTKTGSRAETLASLDNGETWRATAGSVKNTVKQGKNRDDRIRTCEPHDLTHENKAFSDDSPNACRNLVDSGGGGALADALALVARLPLSDAERAEAVRRLLAEAGRQ